MDVEGRLSLPWWAWIEWVELEATFLLLFRRQAEKTGLVSQCASLRQMNYESYSVWLRYVLEQPNIWISYLFKD